MQSTQPLSYKSIAFVLGGGKSGEKTTIANLTYPHTVTRVQPCYFPPVLQAPHIPPIYVSGDLPPPARDAKIKANEQLVCKVVVSDVGRKRGRKSKLPPMDKQDEEVKAPPPSPKRLKKNPYRVYEELPGGERGATVSFSPLSSSSSSYSGRLRHGARHQAGALAVPRVR